jgi:RPA family protein
MAEIKRNIAYKVMVKDILEGEYVKQEGEWSSNFIKLNDLEIARANIIATIISKDNNQAIVDDGSGRITIRSFDQEINSVEVGDFALIIGRPRIFDNELYLALEIIKKISSGWVELRKVELGQRQQKEIVPSKEEKVDEQVEVKAEVKPEVVTESEEVIEQTPSLNIYNMIKEKDQGSGVEIQELVDEIPEAESLVNSLLKKGEVFEVKPGKVKVLE